MSNHHSSTADDPHHNPLFHSPSRQCGDACRNALPSQAAEDVGKNLLSGIPGWYGTPDNRDPAAHVKSAGSIGWHNQVLQSLYDIKLQEKTQIDQYKRILEPGNQRPHVQKSVAKAQISRRYPGRTTW